MYTSMKVYKQILILENLKTSVCPIHLLKFITGNMLPCLHATNYVPVLT